MVTELYAQYGLTPAVGGALWGQISTPATWASATTFTVTDNAANQGLFKEGRFMRGRLGGSGDFDTALRVTDYTTGTVTVDGPTNPLGVGSQSIELLIWFADNAPVAFEPLEASISANFPAADFPAGWKLDVGDLSDEKDLVCINVGGTKYWRGRTHLTSHQDLVGIAASGTNRLCPDLLNDEDWFYVGIYNAANQILGTVDGSNYWRIVLRNHNTDLIELNTSTQTGTSLIHRNVLQNAGVVDQYEGASGESGLKVVVVKVGVPNTITAWAGVEFAKLYGV